MTDKEALEAFSRGKRLDQATVKSLLEKGYIEAREATHLQSPERGWVPIAITDRGKRVLEAE